MGGAYDAGEAVIREVLGALGLKVAGRMPAAFVDLGGQSLKLKRRGQAFKLRTEEELPARARRHIDRAREAGRSQDLAGAEACSR